MLSTYFCVVCNAPHNDPRKIASCSVCGTVGSVKVRCPPALAKAVADVHAAVDADNFDAFCKAETERCALNASLKPPSKR